MDMTTRPCGRCLGTGYVCEVHPGKAWAGITGPREGACEHGAGMPCLACMPVIISGGERDEAAARFARESRWIAAVVHRPPGLPGGGLLSR
jgi:hypothetical protein